MPRLRSAVLLFAGASLLLVAAAAEAQPPKDVYPDRPNHRGQLKSGPEGVGTVSYDPGAPADAIVVLPGTVNLYGNVFDTRNGQPLSPGTVTRVTWYTGPIGTFAPVWYAPSTPVTAVYVGCCSATVPNAFNSATVTIPAPSPIFLGLDVGGTGAFGSLGLRSASTNGQGFHGQQRTIYGAANSLPGQNMMVRISGSIVVPVELLEFDLD